MKPVRRLTLASLPTPLERPARLAERLGIDLWVKRDDATGGPEAGNKIRKLEFLLAEALDSGCDTVLTCGGLQSNHCRATAVAAARLGLRCRLYLRSGGLEDDGGRGVPASEARAPSAGNLLLDRLLGAELLLITPETYQRKGALLAEAADELRERGAKPYVVPEGGSNGRGALGYVAAMEEIRQQLDDAGAPAFDEIIHACGSGGTAAGTLLGAAQYGVAPRVTAMAVTDDAATFETRIRAIAEEARTLRPDLTAEAELVVDDRFKGPAYAVTSPAQRAVMVEVARLSGLVLDPVYTGKAMHGLWDRATAGELKDERILFLHTGGLPGLLAQAEAMSAAL